MKSQISKFQEWLLHKPLLDLWGPIPSLWTMSPHTHILDGAWILIRKLYDRTQTWSSKSVVTVIIHSCSVLIQQDLSIAIYQHLLQGHSGSQRNVHLLGFDLDQDLISRAQTSNPFPQTIQFIPLDITLEESPAELSSYLERFGRRRFNLCTCFAVTMWVHLTHGDAAFLGLLSRLASLCEYLLLEAQPWKCYRSAARRLRKLGRRDFDHFKTLEIRGDMAAHAEEHLEKHCGMELARSFGNTTWDRSLLLFRRRSRERERVTWRKRQSVVKWTFDNQIYTDIPQTEWKPTMFCVWSLVLHPLVHV